jgi:hypothetical protein
MLGRVAQLVAMDSNFRRDYVLAAPALAKAATLNRFLAPPVPKKHGLRGLTLVYAVQHAELASTS